MPCDTGSPVAALQADPAFRGIDFARCTDGWNSKLGVWAADSAALKERARRARSWLKAREEAHVVAVLHGAVSSSPPLCVCVCV